MENENPSTSSDMITVWWITFWKIKVPQKILNFGWRGYHEILPTMKCLFRRNVTRHSNCPLCGFGEDPNAHAVFWCPSSQQVWTIMEYSFLKGSKEEISFKGVLVYATELLRTDELAKLLIASWGIWNERNKITHGQQQRSPHNIKTWVNTYYEELRKVQKTDGETQIESVNKDHMHIEMREYVLLVDASVSIHRQKIGLGAVIVTADKKVQATLMKPLIGSISVLHAEALALLVGLKWGQAIGLPIKLILTDSQILVNALNSTQEYYNEFGVLLSDIRMLWANIPEAIISHINRKYNGRAHSLAKRAVNMEEEMSVFEDVHNHEEA